MMRYLKNFALLVVYVAILFYTITFPSTASWSLFYFASLLILFSFLSVLTFKPRVSLEPMRIQQQKKPFALRIRFTSVLPLWTPFVRLSVKQLPASSPIFVPTLFKRKVEAEFSETPVARGVYSHVHIRLETKDLFGWFSRQLVRQLPVEWSIYPQPLTPDLYQQVLKQLPIDLSLKKNGFINNMELKQLRTYRQQDPMRDIDWKASFRKQRLLVKEYETEDTKPLNLFFLAAPSASFEQLLSLTYTIYLDFSQHRPVRLFLIGQYNGSLQVKKTPADFLFIQPVQQVESLFHHWQQLSTQGGQNLVILPQQTKELLFTETRSAPSILTEQALLKKSGGSFNHGN